MRAVAIAALLIAGCTYRPAPVPVVGPPRETIALAGRWQGDYSSAETGRRGTISFALTAAGDSAFGEVVMIPEGWGQPLRRYEQPAAERPAAPVPEVLTINFVRVEGDRVAGTLAPYAEPRTGTQLFTRFEGRMVGDTIGGTYTTRPAQSQVTQSGRWKVTRPPS